MPERQHAALFAGQVAGAEDGVGVAVEHRPEQAGIFRGIVFQVGILDEGEIAGGFGDGAPHRRAFALVLLVAEKADFRIGVGEPLEHVGGAVGGAVIHDHQLALDVFGQGRRDHLGNAALHHGALIVNRHEDRKFHSTL